MRKSVDGAVVWPFKCEASTWLEYGCVADTFVAVPAPLFAPLVRTCFGFKGCWPDAFGDGGGEGAHFSEWDLLHKITPVEFSGNNRRALGRAIMWCAFVLSSCNAPCANKIYVFVLVSSLNQAFCRPLLCSSLFIRSIGHHCFRCAEQVVEKYRKSTPILKPLRFQNKEFETSQVIGFGINQKDTSRISASHLATNVHNSVNNTTFVLKKILVVCALVSLVSVQVDRMPPERCKPGRLRTPLPVRGRVRGDARLTWRPGRPQCHEGLLRGGQLPRPRRKAAVPRVDRDELKPTPP